MPCQGSRPRCPWRSGSGHADIGEVDVVARQLQIDVVWIVAQRRIEESEVRGDTAERAGAATIRGEDGVGRGRRVVAGPGQYLDRAAIDGRRAGGDDLVGLASRVGLDLIDRVRVEQDIAGDVERADRIARCDRARNCGIADCANSRRRPSASTLSVPPSEPLTASVPPPTTVWPENALELAVRMVVPLNCAMVPVPASFGANA